MCGIAGVFNPTTLPDRETLEQMNDCLAHRGPDDAGVHVDAPVALTHRRLSIIDPESGQQPMFNEDESVCVVFNGEIYNYRALRDGLSGHIFSTDSDTEVLVHLYEEHGPSFVELLDGMFAFALWDAQTERLVLARDRMGIKPLVVARDGDRLSFASEIPALFDSEVDLGGIDRAAIGSYLTLGFVPAPRTAFRNVRKLRPGELAVVEVGGDEITVDRKRYYRPRIPVHNPGIEVAASELRSRVERGVERRLMSDVPLGAFLSGGIDSSIVVGTMASLMDDPVQTFTVGFDESRFDESWAAREVAEYHGTDHHEYTVTPDDVRETIPDVLDRLGEPFADPSLIPTSLVARETAQDVTVALSGDGADELFAGYSKYRGEYLSKYYRALPKPIRSVTNSLLNTIPAYRTTTVGEFGRQARKFNRGSEPNPIARHLAWLRLPEDGVLEDATTLDSESEAHRVLQSAHTEASEVVPRREHLGRMLTVDTQFGLPNQMLHKVDLAGMYSSLEVRVPFLDREIVEYALSLPLNYKITPTKQKRVLRRAFGDVLPQTIQERGKQGFDMPIGEWLSGPLSTEFEETIRTIRAPFLRTDHVEQLFNEHCRGSVDHSKFLWSVYVFGRWEKQLGRHGVPLGYK